jgi:hypothetical protein
MISEYNTMIGKIKITPTTRYVGFSLNPDKILNIFSYNGLELLQLFDTIEFFNLK